MLVSHFARYETSWSETTRPTRVTTFRTNWRASFSRSKSRWQYSWSSKHPLSKCNEHAPEAATHRTECRVASRFQGIALPNALESSIALRLARLGGCSSRAAIEITRRRGPTKDAPESKKRNSDHGHSSRSSLSRQPAPKLPLSRLRHQSTGVH